MGQQRKEKSTQPINLPVANREYKTHEDACIGEWDEISINQEGFENLLGFKSHNIQNGLKSKI